MINIKAKDQTYKTFFVKDKNGKEYEFYKYWYFRSKIDDELLCKILNIHISPRNAIVFNPILNFYDSSKVGRNYKNKWNYLIHSTSIVKIDEILKSGILKPHSIKHGWFEENHNIEKTFCSYIFSDLIYKGTKWFFFDNGENTCILVFDISLLNNDNTVCPATEFAQCILQPNPFEIKTKKDITILKNHINDIIETDRRMKKDSKDDDESFRHSHEVVLNEINLKKYLVGILVYKKNVSYINTLLNKYDYSDTLKVIILNNNIIFYKSYFNKLNK